MHINYTELANNYRPENEIKWLLIGEAPPPNGDTYFYLPKVPIRKDSMPKTIFMHYFDDIPDTEEKYQQLLEILKSMGVFLVDIVNENIKVRDIYAETFICEYFDKKPLMKGVRKKEFEEVLRNIPLLEKNLKNRGIAVPSSNWIFLLPGSRHRISYIKSFYPDSRAFRWHKFRRKEIKCPCNNIHNSKSSISTVSSGA